MHSMNIKELESKQKIISDFFHSDSEKIYLVIGFDEYNLYNFLEAGICLAAGKEENLVLQYEIWQKEHSRHFLYRWLRETVFGQAFRGFGSWSELVHAEPQLSNQLQLLIEKDIRPLEIRFLEAVRFIAAKLKPAQHLILCIVPRTSLQDKVLVDFFRAVLRTLPVRTKLLIGQDSRDVLAQQADFCPSNRLVVDSLAEKEATNIRARFRNWCRSENLNGRLMGILIHMVHPVSLGLLAEVTGETPDTLRKALESADLQDLVECNSDSRFRLVYPRLLSSVEIDGPESDPLDLSALDRQAVEYFEKRLAEDSRHYPNALFHALALYRIDDPEFSANHALTACRMKLDMGGGDICELELDRALNLMGDRKDELQAKLLLKLGEVRESRQRNREALEALDPAIAVLKESAVSADLSYALELKGRAAFALREMDTAQIALEESLRLARELGHDDRCADLSSQLGYLHFSLIKLDEAESLYRQSLDLYRSFSKTNPEEGRRGEAAQWANLGHTRYAKGEHDKAEEYHRQALEMYESIGDGKAAANQWGYIGHTFFALEDYKKAIQAYERAAKMEEELGESHKAAQRYANVGHSMYAQRKIDLAIRSFRQALDKYRELGHPEGEAAQLSNLGLVEGDHGEFKQAVEYFNQAAQIYRELGDTINETTQIVRIGHVRRAQKQFDEAARQYKAALDRYRKLGYLLGEGDTGMELGQLFSEREDWNQALESYDCAGKIFAQLGHKEKEALCLMLIGQAQKGRKKVDAALQAMRRAMDLYKQMDNSLGLANVVSQMGLLQYEQQNFSEAERLYREALEVFRQKKDPEGEANLLSNLGTLYYQTRQLEKARDKFEKALALLRKMNHPPGIAGVLMNLSFVSEKQSRYGDAYSQIKEAGQIFEQLGMSAEADACDQRLVGLDQKAGKSLESMRAELFPGLFKPDPQPNQPKSKVGRNDPCLCGSGKKYKKCCGV